MTAVASAQSKPITGYAQVNGLKMYYEIHGEGQPLVLIHGAFNTIPMVFGQMIPELSKNRKVIAVEMQGHGRTADIDRGFSFESMADDVAALIRYLKIDSADICGYSMGGAIALQTAIRHPKLVKKMIVISCAFRYEGWSDETRSILPIITPEMFEGTPLKSEYDSLAPDPKHWKTFVNKMVKFVSKPFDFKAENLNKIKSPALVMAADGDGVMPEHAVAMYRALGGKYMVDFGPTPKTQLALLPGQSHVSIMMQSGLVLSLIIPFLDSHLQ